MTYLHSLQNSPLWVSYEFAGDWPLDTQHRQGKKGGFSHGPRNRRIALDLGRKLPGPPIAELGIGAGVEPGFSNLTSRIRQVKERITLDGSGTELSESVMLSSNRPKLFAIASVSIKRIDAVPLELGVKVNVS